MTAPSHTDTQEIPLLKTKLHIPRLRPAAQRVARPRLIEHLNRGLHRKLTLVSAPAGFGKTTLLSEWAASAERPTAWLSLDKGDNDPTRFWSYVITALQTIYPDIGRVTLAIMQSSLSTSAEQALTTLINEITEVSAPFVLVLDDLHLITERQIHDALIFTLDNLPLPMHLIVSSRADPSWPLTRLRVRGEMTELREADLRFTSEEAAAFLNNAMLLDLSPEDVDALQARTEGWITGLQMAATSMQGRKRTQGIHAPSKFIQAFTGSHRFILDYLMEEVLDQQPPVIQEFLLKTSVLERMNASLCDAVTDRNDSQAILAQLEQANLFLFPLDDERRWYRYHRLFADFLRQRLHQTQPNDVQTLHLQASQWYEHNKLTAEAADHALAAQDLERAAHLVEQVAEATLMLGQVTTFLSWIERLPDELVRTRPVLCVYHAWALLMAGRPWSAVESRLQSIDGDVDLRGQAAPLQAFIAALRGLIPRATELSRQALKQLPEDDLFQRSIAAWVLGASHIVDGDIVAVRQALDEIARSSYQVGNVIVAVMVRCHLAQLSVTQGQLRQAQALYQQALALATDGQVLSIAGEALMGLGELSREWNDLDTATRYLQEGIELTKQWGRARAMDGYISLAHVKRAQGDLDSAHEAIQKAQQLAIEFDAIERDDFLVAAHQAHLWIAQSTDDPDSLELAIRWAEERGLEADTALAELEQRARGDLTLIHHRRTLEYLTLARLLTIQGHPDRALALLEKLLATAEQWKLNGRVIQIQALKALILQAQSDVEQAMTVLEYALSLAEPEGYVRLFVDEGEPMAELLRHAATHNIVPEYVSRLVEAFETQDEPRTKDKELAPGLSKRQRIKETVSSPIVRPSPMVEPLTERELDVLRLLNTHLSSSEIAQELFIAKSTVRSHIKSIYSKLNVHKRGDAVQQAKELGLL